MPPRNKPTGAIRTHLLADQTDTTGITCSTDQTEQKLALIFVIEEVRGF
jgi:hypothetical protein